MSDQKRYQVELGEFMGSAVEGYCNKTGISMSGVVKMVMMDFAREYHERGIECLAIKVTRYNGV